MAPLVAAPLAPSVFIKQGIDELVDTLKTNADEESRYQNSLVIFKQNFDLPRLAGMTLGGRNWKAISNEERMLFTEKYSEFVLRFYLSKMKGLESTPFEIGTAELKGSTRAVVPATITHEGNQAEVRYSLILKDEKWKIYDVDIEGIRLSTTYRSQFSKLMKRGDIQPLLKELDSMIKKAKSGA
jgi:phospholipid transport system substrate-binding protein